LIIAFTTNITTQTQKNERWRDAPTLIFGKDAKKLWRLLSKRHSFLGFKFFYA